MTAAVDHTPSPAVSRRAMLVLSVAVWAYVVAVMHRTSFGVAGIQAADRFGANATVLGLFVVVQLGVYAGMQIPVGIALDRFGSRRLIVTGMLITAVGQLGLATVGSVGWALVARVLIGAGDACIFISVIRLLPAWLPPRRVPVANQLVGMLGQLGQVLSAVPLLSILHAHGWVPMFTTAAVVGLATTALAFAFVRDAPESAELGPVGVEPGALVSDAAVPVPVPVPVGAEPDAAAPVGSGPTASSQAVALRRVMARPGTWLGFWTHFGTGFSAMVVVMLWGVPFLVTAEGLSTGQASALLLVNSATALVCGPIVGALSARHPLRRSWMVLGSASATALAWAVVLLSPTPLPFGVLVAWMVVIAAGGPVSLVGFDFARKYNPPHELGRASGVVNVGGFLATVLSILAVSAVLDAVSPAGARTYDLHAYRLAFSTLALPWLAGVLGVVGSRRRVRASMAEDGVPVPPLRDAIERERKRRSQS